MLQIGSILFEDLAYDHIDKVEYFSRLSRLMKLSPVPVLRPIFPHYLCHVSAPLLQSCSTTEKSQGQGKQSHEYGRYGDEVMDDDLAWSWIFLMSVSVQGF